MSSPTDIESLAKANDLTESERSGNSPLVKFDGYGHTLLEPCQEPDRLIKRPPSSPLTRAEVKAAAFRLTGITPEQLGREVVESVHPLMQAAKVKFATEKGKITDRRDVADNATRL